MTTKMQEVLTEAHLGEDETIVALHAMLLGNTVGGRPSDCARIAVRDYRRMGRHAFIAAHYADHQRALAACGCGTCQRDLAASEAPAFAAWSEQENLAAFGGVS